MQILAFLLFVFLFRENTLWMLILSWMTFCSGLFLGTPLLRLALPLIRSRAGGAGPARPSRGKEEARVFSKGSDRLLAGLALAAALLLALSGGTGALAAAEEGGKTLSLAQAQEIALQNNSNLALARRAVENAQVALREAQDAAADIPAASVTTYLGNPLLGGAGAVTKYVTPAQKANDLAAAQRRLADAEKQVRVGVEKAYYDLLEAWENIRNKEAALSRARENLRLAQARLEAGRAARVEVLAQELAVNSAEAELEAARDNYEKLLLDFNQLLGLPLDTRVALSEEFSFTPLEVDLEKTLAQTLEEDSRVLNAADALHLAQVNLEQAGRFFTPKVYTYRQADFAVQQARETLAAARTQVEVDVKKAKLNLDAAATAYPLAEKALELARERERLVRLQYEVGLVTSLDLQGAEDALAEAEAGVLKAVHAYNLAQTPFKYGLFVTSQTMLQNTGGYSATGESAGLNQAAASGAARMAGSPLSGR